MSPDFAIIDTHCHLDIPKFGPNIDSIVACSRSAGVTDFIIPGYVYSGWDRIIKLCLRHDFLHPAAGLHPMYLEQHKDGYIEELRCLVRQNQLVAIGEIGLDFQNGRENAEAQQRLFEGQLAIAAEAQLPLLLHVRKAHDQVLAIIRRNKFTCGGIVHAFNGSRQQADHYIKLNFKLGYGGTLTYERALRIRRLAAELPLGCIVLETDAPDIPLAWRREKINSPQYLPEILDTLATLRPESKTQIARQTTANARQVLGLDRSQQRVALSK